MKSGDKFINIENGCIYTLQKLPDFDLWILVANNKYFTQWKNTENAYTPMDAFGGWFSMFKAVVD